MEFIDPAHKQKHKKRLAIGYVLLTILVALSTYMLVATAMGYQIFQKDGQVVQNGLIFLDSKPVNADIYINGKKESSKTDTRLALAEGDYEIILKSEGYKDWTRRITLYGGKVSFINYPRLFPKELKVTDLKAYQGANSGFLTQSPDRRWILFQDNLSSTDINVIDTTKESEPQQILSIPVQALGTTTAKFGAIKVIEWSSDNKHFLVQHVSKDGVSDFAIINREDPTKSININSLFNLKPDKVGLYDAKVEKVYMYFAGGGILRLGNVKDKTIGSQIFDQVLDFKQISENRLMFATTKNATAGKVTVNAVDGDKTFYIGEVEYDPSNQYVLESSQFNGDWYYAVGSKTSEKLQIYKNPQNFSDSINDKKPTVLTSLRAGLPEYVKFSPQRRFLLMQGPQAFSVYDADLKSSFRINLPSKLDPGTTISWVDEFIIQYVIEGKLYFSDFDGKNVREIATVKTPYKGLIDSDFKRLYTINSISGVVSSQVTKLTL